MCWILLHVMQTENAIQSHSHLKLFKNSECATLSPAECISEWGMAFLYCSVSEHLSQDFQDGLAFFTLIAMRSLSLDVTAFPDVQA